MRASWFPQYLSNDLENVELFISPDAHRRTAEINLARTRENALYERDAYPKSIFRQQIGAVRCPRCHMALIAASLARWWI